MTFKENYALFSMKIQLFCEGLGRLLENKRRHEDQGRQKVGEKVRKV